MAAMIRLIDLLMIPLTLFAGVYRVVAYKPLTFGGIGTGLLTWIGIAAVYPACAFPPTPHRAQPWAIGLWAALAVVAYVKMFNQWCSPVRRNPRRSHCWCGSGEPFFAFAFAIAMTAFAGNGAGMFFFAGFVCSMAQLWLLVLRGRLERWTPQDTDRLFAPLRAGQARAAALAAWVKQAVPTAGRFALARALLGCSFTGMALRAAWLFWRGRAAARTAAAATAHARPPTFMGRVGSFLVGHAVWSIVVGGLGLGVVFKTIGLILTIPAAIIIWIAGGEARLPGYAEDATHSTISRIEAGLKGQKDKALKRLGHEREEWEERLRHGRDEARERFEDGRGEIAGQARSAGRKAVLYSITH